MRLRSMRRSIIIAAVALATIIAPPAADAVAAEPATAAAASAAASASARPPIVARWSVLDVSSWLCDLGLCEHSTRVADELIDGEALLELSMREWEEQLGVRKLGHRKRIEKAIREIMRGGGGGSDTHAQEQMAETELEHDLIVDHIVPLELESAAASAAVSAAAANLAAAAAKAVPEPERAVPYVAAPQTKPATPEPSAAKPATPPSAAKKSKQQQQQPAARPPKPSGFVNVLSAEAGILQLDDNSVTLPAARTMNPGDDTRLAALMRDAVALHHRNDLAGARKLYNQALALQPRHARALHMSALIAMQLESDSPKALRLLHQSLKLSRNDGDTLVNLGNFHWAQNDFTKALVAWKRALDLSPLAGGPTLRVRYAEALYAQALSAHSAGLPHVTREYLEHCIVVCAEAMYMHFPSDWSPPMSRELTRLYFHAGKRGREQALAMDGSASAVGNSGSFISMSPLQLLASNADTSHSLRVVLADSWLHLGMLLLDSPAQWNLAAAYLKRSMQVAPDALDASKPQQAQIATIQLEAKGYYEQLRSRMSASPNAPASKRQQDQTWLDMLRTQVDLKGSDPARVLSAKGRGVSFTPSVSRSRNKKLIEHLHKTCHTSAAFEMARFISDDLVFESPRYAHLYESDEEMLQTRSAFLARLDDLLSDPTLPGKWAQGAGLEWCRFRFYLAYHGVNNREILEKLSRVYQIAAPVLEYTSPHLQADPTNGLAARLAADGGAGARIKVAFISAFLSNHPVGKTIQGYIHHLPRSRFEVIVYLINLQQAHSGGDSADAGASAAAKEEDPVLKSIKMAAQKCVVIPQENWPLARSLIDQDRPDVLIYGDIGMEPTSYFLAFSRLAPIQALTFGHPDTSGLPGRIDYFLSHAGMEEEDDAVAQSYYSERLVKLPGVGYWYRSHAPNMAFDRSHYGVSDRELESSGVDFPASLRAREASGRFHSKYTMYLVTKSVQFFSPSFLDALAGILHRHPGSFLALVMDTGKNTRGYDMHNACIDLVFEGIESRLRALKVKEGSIEDLSDAEHAAAAEAAAQRRASRHPPSGGHPAENDVLGSILRSAPPPLSRPGISGRIRFIDRGDHAYFLGLLCHAADVLLQPLPLDGTTTTLEAVSCAVPTVVHRSAMIGGKMAAALYEHMGVRSTLATSVEQYIDIAVRLGTEPAFHEQVRSDLQQATEQEHRLFEDPRAIEAYVDWIEGAVKDKIAETQA